jgi:hypothetical protein
MTEVAFAKNVAASSSRTSTPHVKIHNVTVATSVTTQLKRNTYTRRREANQPTVSTDDSPGCGSSTIAITNADEPTEPASTESRVDDDAKNL